MKTILIVEDHDDSRIIYRTALEHAGYRVLEARDAPSGLATALRQLPDLILMDISLPGMDGCEAAGRLKASPQTRHIPVIALTAHAMVADRERAMAAGCDDFLPKPAPPRLVIDEVARWLDGRR